MSPDAAVALALDAFLAEHRGCWRLYGEGLETRDEESALSLLCECGAVLTVPR
jgi:hypothetical protein